MTWRGTNEHRHPFFIQDPQPIGRTFPPLDESEKEMFRSTYPGLLSRPAETVDALTEGAFIEAMEAIYKEGWKG